jgi:hypothetical protein
MNYKIGNLYSIDTDYQEAIKHFKKKHSMTPTAILIHPDNLEEVKGIEVIPDKRQSKGAFELIVEVE